MRAVPLDRAPTHLVDLRGRGTPELLAAFLEDAHPDDPALEVLATRIDGAEAALTTWVSDELRADYGLSADDAARLATAFELGRRAASPAPPVAITRPADVAAIAHRELGGLPRETVLVIACDVANRPVRTAVVSHGAVSSVLVPAREILHFVLRWDCSAFAVAHNHPAGACEPSYADVAATERLAVAARAVGLRFLGHVVVCGRQWQTVAIDGH